MLAETPPPLPLTGERTVPGIPHENYWFQRHVAAYRLAAARCPGRRVVDAGCGEGYGVAMLAGRAVEVTGVELDPAVAEHARTAYPGRTFLTADVCEVPLPDASADVVVSLQVIEHLPDVGRYLREQHRLLRPGGELLCATPNRLTFTPHDQGPVNVFHVEEFTAAELRQRLRDLGGFEVTWLLGLHHGARIRRVEELTGRPFTDLVLQPVEDWPPWLHTVVRRITPDDFTWADTDLDASLDLLAIARRGATGRTP